jgi:hypothetical protein
MGKNTMKKIMSLLILVLVVQIVFGQTKKIIVAPDGSWANVLTRVKWAKQLTDREVKQYTLKNIFENWNPLKKK